MNQINMEEKFRIKKDVTEVVFEYFHVLSASEDRFTSTVVNYFLNLFVFCS